MWLPKKLLKKCINQNVKSSLESRKSWNYTYSFCSPCLRNIAFLKCWDAAVPSPAEHQPASTSPCPSTSEHRLSTLWNWGPSSGHHWVLHQQESLKGSYLHPDDAGGFSFMFKIWTLAGPQLINLLPADKLSPQRKRRNFGEEWLIIAWELWPI